MTLLTGRPKTRPAARLGVLVAMGALAVSACGGVKTTTGSEDYPSGDVQMTVGADAGGSTDLISRAVSKGLSKELGVSFPVVNKPGANGTLNASELMTKPADGSHIAVQNASLFAITPLAVSEDEVTNIEDFDVLYGISRDDYVLVASKESGFTSIDDLAAAKRTINFSTTGVGTGSQLSSVLVFKTAGIEARAIPFDGGAPALTALLGGQVDVSTMQVGEAIENIEAGKVVPLTVFSEERIPQMPDVPTAREQGVDVSVSQYRFLTAPKGTPEAVKKVLIDALKATFKTKAYEEFNKHNALNRMEIPGDKVVAQLKEDKERYAKLVKEYDIDLTKS